MIYTATCLATEVMADMTPIMGTAGPMTGRIRGVTEVIMAEVLEGAMIGNTTMGRCVLMKMRRQSTGGRGRSKLRIGQYRVGGRAECAAETAEETAGGGH